MKYEPKHMKDPDLVQAWERSLLLKWWGFRGSLSDLQWNHRTDAELRETVNALFVTVNEITELLDLKAQPPTLSV
jgi:hypothetical protein